MREAQQKPHLMDWILQQEGTRRKVLLEVFTGIPERECARRLGMPLTEVTDIVSSAIKDGPIFAEDDYVMTYHATSSMDEFCRVSGQGEGVYKLLSLRYPKRRPKVEHVVFVAPAVPAGGVTTEVAKPKARPKKAKASKPKATSKKAATMPEPEEPSAPKPPRDEEAARRRREERRAARELARAERLSEQQR